MAKAQSFFLSGLVVISWMSGLGMAAQSVDPAAIQLKLNAQFKLTRTTADRTDIVTPGDVVEIEKPGLLMYSVASPLPPSNAYKNGRISQGWGGFGKDLSIGMLTPGGGTAADYPHRPFVVGEKCWITGIQVQKDGVLFQLYSDPYDDIRYYANLKIPFPDKKAVPPVDTALQLVGEVLTVVQQNQGEQGAQPTPEPPPTPAVNSEQTGQQAAFTGEFRSERNGIDLTIFADTSVLLQYPAEFHMSPVRGQSSVNGDTLSVAIPRERHPLIFKIQGDQLIADKGVVWDRQGGAPVPAPAAAPEPIATPPPAPAAMPAIAPPPPPADAPPPTIELGQTKDQVTAGFGQPQKVANLGAKTIFYYKDMKVTFTNGKVSNVE
jgi:hypothetical protein